MEAEPRVVRERMEGVETAAGAGREAVLPVGDLSASLTESKSDLCDGMSPFSSILLLKKGENVKMINYEKASVVFWNPFRY